MLSRMRRILPRHNYHQACSFYPHKNVVRCDSATVVVLSQSHRRCTIGNQIGTTMFHHTHNTNNNNNNNNNKSVLYHHIHLQPSIYQFRSLSNKPNLMCVTSFGKHHQLPLLSSMTVRNMGGGPRNSEHTERLRAIRKARKIYFESLPERPEKPPVCTKHYDEVIQWRTEPISKKIEHRVIHICSFIIYAWLNAYPAGASLRKLQRDIAFRMQRKHRLPGKLPYQAIMPIVGKLERENYLSIRMKSNGQVLIYRDKEVNIVPAGQTNMEALSKDAEEDDDENDNPEEEARFDIPLLPHEVADVDIDMDEEPTMIPRPKPELWDFDPDEDRTIPDAQDVDTEEDPTLLSRPIPEDQVPYEVINYRPKFTKQLKPKVKKVKKKKVIDRSDPIMDPIELPPDTIQTSRGPRYMTSTTSDTTTTATNTSINTASQESSSFTASDVA